MSIFKEKQIFDKGLDSNEDINIITGKNYKINNVPITSINVINVKDYGAIGNGIANDTSSVNTALSLAISSGKPLYFPKGKYLIATMIDITGQVEIFGDGINSILYTTSNISILRMNANNITIRNLRFEGNGTGATQIGIWGRQNDGWKIENCYFTLLNFSGFYGSSSVAANFNGGTLSGCRFYNNLYGIYLDQRYEYASIDHCQVFDCQSYGIYSKAGNITIVGGTVTDCSGGIKFEAGENDSHSSITGMLINHNPSMGVNNNLYFKDIFAGMEVTGCQIWGGDVLLDGCKGVQIQGCEFGNVNIKHRGDEATSINNCIFEEGCVVQRDVDSQVDYARYIGNTFMEDNGIKDSFGDKLANPYIIQSPTNDDDIIYLQNKSGNTRWKVKDDGTEVAPSVYNSEINRQWLTEELTISVGQGSTGVNTTIQIPVTCDIIEVSAVISQAPGGGATTFDIGRTGGNIDEFLQSISTVLDTSGSFAQGDGDGASRPQYNSTAVTLVVTTDANVTISDMKIKICIFYQQYIKPNN